MKTIDVGSLLDDAQWSAYQKLLVAGTAMTIILDGLDNQLLGAAVPALMREWNLPRPAFVPVQTAGLVGMMIGGAIGGVLGDRLGRRIALLGSVITFGLLTMLVPVAGGVGVLTVLRFFAGLGLGGAMPNAAALSSEYVPRRQRPFAVTLTIVCIPLGGSLAGFVGAQVLPRFGWRALFLVGGILPLVMAAVLLKVLPESPRFLARVPDRWPQLRALLRRLGHSVPDDAVFADTTEKAIARVSPRELLTPEFRRDTLALCGSFFFCLLSVYIGSHLGAVDAGWRRILGRRRQLRPDRVQSRRRRRRDSRRVRDHAAGIARHDAGHGGRSDRRRDRARLDGDRTAVRICGTRHAGVDRRPDQRRSNDDVRARRPRLSHGGARHGRRDGRGVRARRRRAQPVRSVRGRSSRAVRRATSA